MNKLTSFFWFCSGADQDLLKKCPTESGKYFGIGATVFFTGIFAAIAASYSLYSVFDSVVAAVVFGVVWGLMIFNLDRYIVSSMRKEGKISKELWMAVPRLVLAVLISIVIAKPLELKIFEKEIEPELIVMQQQKVAVQEEVVKSRFSAQEDSLARALTKLETEIASQRTKRDDLARIAQEEADGTGGSRRRNLGPIYKAKKADADRADAELAATSERNGALIVEIQRQINANDQARRQALSSLPQMRMDGPAARIEALDRLTKQSTAMWYAHWFIVLLFIAIETSPVFVKLLSPKGPYDNLLKGEEHFFHTKEIETLASTNAAVKERAGALPAHERKYIDDRLNASLNES